MYAISGVYPLSNVNLIKSIGLKIHTYFYSVVATGIVLVLFNMVTDVPDNTRNLDNRKA